MSDAKSHTEEVFRDSRLILVRVVAGESIRIYLGRTDFSELPMDLAIYVLVSCHGSAFQACVNSQ